MEAAEREDSPPAIQQVQHIQTAGNPQPEPNQAATANNPPDEPDWLGKASAAVQRGDNRGAASYLLHHLQLHPDHVMIRAYIAELQFKCGDWPQSQHHFEKFVAEVQDNTGQPHKQLIHCHTRLMEIAQQRKDSYGEHLHRGIGMILVERQVSEIADPKEDESAFKEKLLCKAVMELEKARSERPNEARPCWYLHEAFSKLDQVIPAQRALRQADERKTFSLLTPAESRDLTLAVAVR